MSRKPRITVTLDARLVQAIDEAARREFMDRSSWLNSFLSMALLFENPPSLSAEMPPPGRARRRKRGSDTPS